MDPAATSGAFANRLCSQCNEIWLEAFPRLPDGRPIDGAPQSVAKITAIAIKTKHAGHLVAMALLAVTWDAEICNLPWDWEVQVRKLGTSVFIVPGWHAKNEFNPVVVLNATARCGRDLKAEVKSPVASSY